MIGISTCALDAYVIKPNLSFGVNVSNNNSSVRLHKSNLELSFILFDTSNATTISIGARLCISFKSLAWIVAHTCVVDTFVCIPTVDCLGVIVNSNADVFGRVVGVEEEDDDDGNDNDAGFGRGTDTDEADLDFGDFHLFLLVLLLVVFFFVAPATSLSLTLVLLFRFGTAIYFLTEFLLLLLLILLPPILLLLLTLPMCLVFRVVGAPLVYFLTEFFLPEVAAGVVSPPKDKC